MKDCADFDRFVDDAIVGGKGKPVQQDAANITRNDGTGKRRHVEYRERSV